MSEGTRDKPLSSALNDATAELEQVEVGWQSKLPPDAQRLLDETRTAQQRCDELRAELSRLDDSSWRGRKASVSTFAREASLFLVPTLSVIGGLSPRSSKEFRRPEPRSPCREC